LCIPHSLDHPYQLHLCFHPYTILQQTPDVYLFIYDSGRLFIYLFLN